MADADQQAARRQRRATSLDEGHARALAVLDDMAARANGANPLMVAGLRRQARSYLRHLATMQAHPWYADHLDQLAAHEADLRRRLPETDGRPEPPLGVRIAFMGKGGAGKTVVSSTFARLLARRGRKVLAADMDRSPGLAYSVGMHGKDVRLPPEVLEQSDLAAYGWQLRADLLPRDVVEHHTVAGPDGVRLTSFGKITTVDKDAAKQTMVALIQLLYGFGEPDWDVVCDLEAGPTEPFERYHAFSEDVLVVVGPAWRSALTARRLLPMVGEGRTTTVVANRFRDEPDHPGLTPDVRIPFDLEVAEAERQGLSPLDACPDSPTIKAIERALDRFVPPLAAGARRSGRPDPDQ